MTKEQLFGALRALLAWIGGDLISRGVIGSDKWSLITGLVMAIGTAAYSFFVVHDLTLDAVLGVVRAAVAMVGGVLQSSGLITSADLAQIASAIPLLVSAAWSIYAHRPRGLNTGDGGVGADPAGGANTTLGAGFLVLLMIPLIIALAGCNPGQIDASVQALCAAKDAAAAAAIQAVNDAADPQAQKDAQRAKAYADAGCKAATAVSAAYAKSAAK